MQCIRNATHLLTDTWHRQQSKELPLFAHSLMKWQRHDLNTVESAVAKKLTSKAMAFRLDCAGLYSRRGQIT